MASDMSNDATERVRARHVSRHVGGVTHWDCAECRRLALAAAEARGRRAGLEEAAREADDAGLCSDEHCEETRCGVAREIARAVRTLATQPQADTERTT